MRKTTVTNEINTLGNNQTHLFAAANTSDGFVSFFDRVFNHDGINKIYILKGGPGSGKSTIMKNYAKDAEKQGFTPIYYHCSSDPHSLDGVTIKETGISIVDGTLPHAFEPLYPGIRDFYVDLSSAWNTDILARNAQTIKQLVTKKKGCYNTAYRLLRASGEVYGEMTETAKGYVDAEKLKSFIKRFAHRYLKPKSNATSSVSHVITEANSSEGFVRYFTLEKEADTVFFIKDAYLASHFLLEELKNEVERADTDAVFAMSAYKLNHICAIYLPVKRLCISLYNEDMAEALAKAGKDIKIINTSRFINAQACKMVRQKYRFANKCREALTNEALEQLRLAGVYHKKLEEIYISATDYNKVTEIASSIS